ncbi:hypothetical protein WICPIJ_009214 [Wickerhamomyces pijperi]|uniref:N-acetyltransferase domain-containing protein n=1 Tax=Wickerhamomyces pijperi TaxID=599730 RepID=A0A9P8PPI2_WICPI|nr:hypothetical protein WICPIJ_009214 [Wickerhamomyces pijperi]
MGQRNHLHHIKSASQPLIQESFPLNEHPAMVQISYSQLDIHNESDIKALQTLISVDLSEPYSIYVYKFFLNQWPNLCYIARDAETSQVIGTIVSKLEPHKGTRSRGYIGMLAVKTAYRGQGIAKKLVRLSIEEMIKSGADEVMLETEVVNAAAIRLYENMGFLRSKRLFRYYMNQHDAFRLILPLTERSVVRSTFLEPLKDPADAGKLKDDMDLLTANLSTSSF